MASEVFESTLTRRQATAALSCLVLPLCFTHRPQPRKAAPALCRLPSRAPAAAVLLARLPVAPAGAPELLQHHLPPEEVAMDQYLCSLPFLCLGNVLKSQVQGLMCISKIEPSRFSSFIYLVLFNHF